MAGAWNDAMLHQQQQANFIQQAGMQNQLSGTIGHSSTWTDTTATYTGWYDPQNEFYRIHIPLEGDPVPQYIWKDGKMENIEVYQDHVRREIEAAIVKDREKRKKLKKEMDKVEVKLTLGEARHLEEACEKDSELKEILSKIEKEVDFTIVVSFRDDKSKKA